MKTLAEIYAKYAGPASWGDKGTIHSYIEVYERLFSPYRDTAKFVLEIGIMGGQSLRMWEEYFSASEVHGIDLCDQPLDMADLRPMLAEPGHHITLMDATHKQAVDSRFKAVKFDVVIEDASHALEHQLKIYENFKPHLAPGFIYVIEDVNNIDAVRPVFEALDPEKRIEIIDRRKIKGRYDDVLIVITDR